LEKAKSGFVVLVKNIRAPISSQKYSFCTEAMLGFNSVPGCIGTNHAWQSILLDFFNKLSMKDVLCNTIKPWFLTILIPAKEVGVET